MVRTVQTLLHSQLACNEMQASARTCRQTRSRQHDRKSRLKSSQSSQYTLIIPHRCNSTNYYLILGSPRQGCAFHKSTQVNLTNKQIPFEASEEPSDTVIHFYFCFFLHLQESSALSQSEAMIVQ